MLSTINNELKIIRTPIPSDRGFAIQTTYLSIMTTLKVVKKGLELKKIRWSLSLHDRKSLLRQ